MSSSRNFNFIVNYENTELKYIWSPLFCFNYLESQCNSKPCQGNGYCKSTGDNSFVCICKLGFEGNLCATKSKFWNCNIYRMFCDPISLLECFFFTKHLNCSTTNANTPGEEWHVHRKYLFFKQWLCTKIDFLRNS